LDGRLQAPNLYVLIELDFQVAMGNPHLWTLGRSPRLRDRLLTGDLRKNDKGQQEGECEAGWNFSHDTLDSNCKRHRERASLF